MKNKQDIYKITSIVLIIDQMIKLWVNHFMKLHQQIKIIPHFFSIYYVKNTGAAFSILKNNNILLIIISVIVILLLNHMIMKEKTVSKLSCISLGMILGGIFGNLMDRIIHHAVIDYLSFASFPIFNAADMAIVIGIGLLIIEMILEKNKKIGGKHESI